MQSALFTTTKVTYAAIICSGLALRSIISLYDYSGASIPPMYGDYEAQRHWQEICVNLPASTWYKNSTENDLLYWGLDYPPLTAYHSLSLGQIAKVLNTSYVELHDSRGFESEKHKTFMRLSVLAVDVLIYIPAILLSVMEIQSIRSNKGPSTLGFQHLAICLFYPGQMLIDNGHFQYNNMSLGLAALAIVAILRERLIFGSIFFSLALNYKQMELYHAVPFFVYLLSSCKQEKTYGQQILKLVKIGTSVIVTFGLLWLPWINSWDNLSIVLRRIFPIYRGVFEDKVSNVWCVLNVVIKLKSIFSNERMALICLIVTGLALVPSSIHLFVKPSKQGFLYSLFNSALAFFLFSFQVHEKSILLPALPAMLLYPMEPYMMTWFLEISTISMFPLLDKDKLVLPFICIVVIYQVLIRMIRKKEPQDGIRQEIKWLYFLSCVMSIALVICHLYAPVPKKLPHVYVLAISVFSCLHFVAFLGYINYKQLTYKTLSKKIHKN
ncbi:probable dolichyl pyrophosphate Man9GlcNAc2 alpha-1,3-glucosyltransferase [Episyrphus balteatus]|uniref:probable dolichyl pyrophosphate Man9GlcNAc2 alpha-1,3-glucosyltransferase n=1 Tax=Episyrphus balteatus TaxID=286459 RepID=UPI0024854E38|nr:probable dolichyl pyrophosphate Man9GlcNAc2 alpha-1,3-glucosyltransferase [Episyrphus balteatus]